MPCMSRWYLEKVWEQAEVRTRRLQLMLRMGRVRVGRKA